MGRIFDKAFITFCILIITAWAFMSYIYLCINLPEIIGVSIYFTILIPTIVLFYERLLNERKYHL